MQIKKCSFLVLSLFLVSILSAQQSDNSPYSRFGLGELTDENFNHLRQMGGLGASYIDAYHINIVNPASNSYLNATAFDFGVFGKRTWLTDNQNTSNIWSGNIEYLSLAFPLRNPINEIYDGEKKDYKLGMSITLMPHSNVSYNILSQDSLPDLGRFNRNYVGTGGTYKLLWGNSLKYKDFSLGVNLGYLFGQIKNESDLVFADAYSYNNYLTSDYNVGGVLWRMGVIYTKVINEKKIEKNKSLVPRRISVGIHANSATNFNTTFNLEQLSVQNLPGIINRDTIFNLSDVSGKGKLPAEFGAGITYYVGEKHCLGVNYTTTLWSQYYNEAASDVKGSLANSTKLAVGGFYRPNYKSFDNFFDRIFYRYGVYYNTDPRVINSEQLKTYGITMGVGMPFAYQRKISFVNLGLNFGVRGQNTPISEKFVKISLGVTFNDDEWFLKRKYN